MTYARIEQNAVVEYPVYEGEIRLRYANVSFPTPFAPPEGYVAVEGAAPPAVSHTQNISEGDPVQSDGKWVQNWVVSDANPEEVASRVEAQWALVRKQRNAKLTASDWTQLSDAPLSNVETQQWATYRQSLRDATAQADPFNITWPTEPGA